MRGKPEQREQDRQFSGPGFGDPFLADVQPSGARVGAAQRPEKQTLIFHSVLFPMQKLPLPNSPVSSWFLFFTKDILRVLGAANLL